MRIRGVIVMRYVVVVLVVVALFFSYHVWGPNARRAGSAKNVSSGVITYGNETLAGLQGNGFVTLDGTYVRNTLMVNGKLEAENAHIGTLKVNGMAELAGTIVDGTSDV